MFNLTARNSSTTNLTVLFLGLLALPVALVSAQTQRIMNSEPAQPPHTVHLEELWRIGGEDDEFIFGMVIDSVTDSDGNLYLLDAQLCQVEVFSPAGDHLRSLSRQGDGPGEIRYPQDLVLLPDGNLGIVMLIPGKLVTLTLDGEPQGDLVLGGDGDPSTGFWTAFNSDCQGRTITVTAARGTPTENGQNRTLFLARISETGLEMTRYRESTMTLDLQQPRLVEAEMLPSFLLASAVGPDGRVYTASSRTEYAIEVYNPDGDLERVICRPYENLPRDDHGRGRVSSLMDSWLQGYPGEVDKVIDPHEPVITGLFVDDENVLWVQHSRSNHNLAEGILLTYDTFAPDGTWLREVSVRCTGNPVRDGLKFLGDGRVLLIKEYVLARWFSLGVPNVDLGEGSGDRAMEIVCLRIME